MKQFEEMERGFEKELQRIDDKVREHYENKKNNTMMITRIINHTKMIQNGNQLNH